MALVPNNSIEPVKVELPKHLLPEGALPGSKSFNKYIITDTFIESSIYDSTNQNLVITLKSGDTVTIPADDLQSGSVYIDANDGPTPNIIRRSKDLLYAGEMLKKNEKAKAWSQSTGIHIITWTRNLKDLEQQMKKYMSYQHDQRHRSDEESILIYGYDNDHRYEIMKKELLALYDKGQRVDDAWYRNEEIKSIPTDTPIKELSLYSNDELASSWSVDTNIPIIIDSDGITKNALEDAYSKYINTDKANRRRSDAKSIELYGLDNQTRYNQMKARILRAEDKFDLHYDNDDEFNDISGDKPILHEADSSVSVVTNKTYKSYNDLYDLLSTMKYGYPDKNGQNIAITDPKTFDDDNWFYQNWKLLSPSKMKHCKCGVCYDFVEFEREYLKKRNINSRSFFMGYQSVGDDFDGPTHTFLVTEDGKYFYWLEYSWYKYKGIHRYNTFEDLLSDVADKFIEGYQSKLPKLFCKEYPKPPKYNIHLKEYHKFIKSCEMPTSESVIQELFNDLSEAEGIDKAQILFNLNVIKEHSDFCTASYIEHIIKDSLNETEDISRKLADTPYFTPSELLDLGVFAGDKNYFSSTPDNTTLDDGITTNQWFVNYTMQYDGLVYENYTAKWIAKLRDLYRDFDSIKESGDEDKINARKQSILELGWNPELEFNSKNRHYATSKINSILEMNSEKYQHVDLTYTQDDPIGQYLDKSIDNNEISPVYIILDKGKKFYSDWISHFTNSEYTHASIGFDADMSQNYTYLANGFSNETIDSYGDDDITVYTFFVSKEVSNKLKTSVQDFKDNAKKSVYDFRRMFDYLVDNTKRKTSKYAQVCSTFVDNILRSAGIGITKITRGIVSPKDIHDSMKENKGKIYKVYDGPAKKYNASKIRGKLVNLRKTSKFKVLKEYAESTDPMINIIYESLIESMNQLSILETKLFPAQFDSDGNLLIYKNKLKKLDYNQEFEESNKLIQIYIKTDNMEGMKYECAKLWFMNSSIEKILNRNHNKDLDRKMLVDCRARILNVFYSTMDIINKKEKDWNFIEYYNKTPFSDASVKVNATTIKYTLATLKSLIH